MGGEHPSKGPQWLRSLENSKVCEKEGNADQTESDREVEVRREDLMFTCFEQNVKILRTNCRF
jgi:hypothetical protein